MNSAPKPSPTMATFTRRAAISRTHLHRCPVRDLRPLAGPGGADDRVAHLGGAVAVLERRAVRSDIGVLDDRGQEVVDLVDEGVLPADHVARRPPPRPEGHAVSYTHLTLP